MCGIAGILNLDRARPANAHVLARMLQSIRHRGPDDDGTIVDQECACGMRRLSIIDLESGKQPIWDESGRYGVVFNGEIYNYLELRRDLESRGHRFATHSDTEVIVHLFEEHQQDCVQSLRGMFAIAVWDTRDRRLFLARDRLGIKPLYYTQADDALIFASEIKAILEHPAVERRMDPIALNDYLALKYVPSPRTLFDGIHSLPPGYWIDVRDGRITINRYWDVSFARNEPRRSEQEYEDELHSLLAESVRLRLRSDVPFGAFLSGGVDSSTIVAVMSRFMDEPVKTFSVGFDGGRLQDELPYARQVAQLFHTDHHEIVVTASDFRSLAVDVLWHLDQPIADQATIATYMVARLASQHVKMVLTGEGGDELFAGYARYAGERYSSLTRWIPRPVSVCVPRVLPWLPGLRRAKIAAYALSIPDEAERFTNWFPMFDSHRRSALCKNGVASVTSHAFRDQLRNCDAVDPLSRMLYVDTKLWLADYLLFRGDKLTMAHSLEARVPLLDHHLVEFAARLPSDLKLNRGQRKYLLKRVAGKLLPAKIIHRRKQGFTIPTDQWLRESCRDLVRDLLSPATIQRRGLFNSDYVQQLVTRHERGFADHSIEIWGLVSLEMWLRRFIDHSSTPIPSSPVPARIASE